MIRHTTVASRVAVILCVGLVVGSWATFGHAQTADELRAKITASQKQLDDIEREIRTYEAQLNQVGSEKKTLQNAIRQLDLSRKKILADVRATEQKISSTDLQIEELDREIRVKDLEVQKNQSAIAALFQTMDELDNVNLVVQLFGSNSLADLWNVVDEHAMLQRRLSKNIYILNTLKGEYQNARGQSEEKRATLDSFHTELSGQMNSLDQTRSEKNSLLGKTKNKESSYQQLLADKKAARDKFEQELNAYESQLKFILDPTSIPVAGSGVLHWPFEPSLMSGRCSELSGALGNAYCLTQYFGNTAFAQSGAYNGKGHNGIDFGVSVGTKVVAALAGTVEATGNTDAVAGCYSYGKWVLLRHANGLSTLYGHLSSIVVNNGAPVVTGQAIGYSGNTGYSTGPHLHFTVFASDGVQVQRLGDIPGRPITGCSPVAIPVAGFEAYLNPMKYLVGQ